MEIPEFFRLHLITMENRRDRHTRLLHKAEIAQEAEGACITVLDEEINELRAKIEEATRGGLFDAEQLDKEANIRKINNN